MKEPSRRQIELLTLITPMPYGKGLKLIQASKLLHINYGQAKYAISKFKTTWPDRWQIIQDMKQDSLESAKFDARLKRNIRNPVLIGALDWSNAENIANDFYFDEEDSSKTVYIKIKEKF